MFSFLCLCDYWLLTAPSRPLLRRLLTHEVTVPISQHPGSSQPVTYNVDMQKPPHFFKMGPTRGAICAPELGSKISLKLDSYFLTPLVQRAFPQPIMHTQIPMACSASKESGKDRHQAGVQEMRSKVLGWPDAGHDLGLSQAEQPDRPWAPIQLCPLGSTLIPCLGGLTQIGWGSGHSVELWGEQGAKQGRKGNSQPFRFLYLLRPSLQTYPHVLKKDSRSLKLNALKREWL